MALTFEDVEDWTRKTGVLESLQTELSQRTTTLSGLQDQLHDIRRLDGWEGSAAHAARQSFDPVDDDIAKAAAAVGAVRTQVGETIADLTEVRGKINDAKQFASANGYTIQFNGTIVDLWDLDDKANASPEELRRHEEARGKLMEMVSEIVARGNEIESEASRVLWAANQGDIGTDGLKDADQAANAGAHFALEPDADPQEVEDWWNGLSPEQQQWMVTNRPDWVRNRDGIPTVARDNANMRWLDTERTRLQAELDRELAANPYPNAPGADQSSSRRIQELRSTIRDLDKIHEAAENPNTYLIGLDTSGDSTKAIVSVGNPDEADHVSVTIPGMGSQKDAGGTIEGMVREGTLMRSEAMTQLENAGRGNETVATVAWLGYDTPPGIAEAGADARATGAAPVLSNYLESVEVTSASGDPHLTLVGHSYGSVVSGMALNEGANAVVDDYVAYGSPGFYAMDEADLGMQQGHVFVMQAPDDPIQNLDKVDWLPGLGWRGGDPADGSFVQLSTEAGTTPDGVYRAGASGHSEYPRPFQVGGNDVLRTTGYNTAVVVAGLPELAVRK
ncbi:alpha/beta hydrolase [Mycobacterium hubeiense]|uniref:alpha/beta hydrolase n=1 Tax=Mycobacterium hubeiense TaxID=1867256 RepID=UPI000C7F05BB|nr:alpha/beta hydrolase [Mycobacterium sp. QGD 101]